MANFNEWFIQQFGRRYVPTIERAIRLRERYEALQLEADKAKMAWQREHTTLSLYDAALKGYSMGRYPNRNKGGAARAAKPTPERRKEIAQKAARARWGREKKQ